MTVSFSNTANEECRPQLDNPSALLPDDNNDYALKDYMASQEEVNRYKQEQFKKDLENEFQLSLEEDESSNDGEETQQQVNNAAHTQGTFEAANVLATGFFAFNNAATALIPNNNNITSVANNNIVNNPTSAAQSAARSTDHGARQQTNSNIAAELVNQLRAHGFAGLSEEDQKAC